MDDKKLLVPRYVLVRSVTAVKKSKNMSKLSVNIGKKCSVLASMSIKYPRHSAYAPQMACNERRLL